MRNNWRTLGLVLGSIAVAMPSTAQPVVQATPSTATSWQLGVGGGFSAMPQVPGPRLAQGVSPGVSLRVERRLVPSLWLTSGLDLAATAGTSLSDAQITSGGSAAATARGVDIDAAGWVGAVFGLRPVLNPGDPVEFFGDAQVTGGVLGDYQRATSQLSGSLANETFAESDRWAGDVVGRLALGAGAEYRFADAMGLRVLTDVAVWMGGPFSQNDLGASLALEPQLALFYRF